MGGHLFFGLKKGGHGRKVMTPPPFQQGGHLNNDRSLILVATFFIYLGDAKFVYIPKIVNNLPAEVFHSLTPQK